ncbi:MAG: beta-class carbonic anhydrase [Nocardioides sp.]
MSEFDDLLAANAAYAADFNQSGFDGIAHAGVAIVTCMDSRIEPLAMLGLTLGDAKIFRNPGGRVTPQAMEALVLGTHLLGVKRILIVEHTRCAMASNSEDAIHARITASAGVDSTWQPINVITDQTRALSEDVHKVTSHPLIPESVAVAGFLYDVDSGRLERQA